AIIGKLAFRVGARPIPLLAARFVLAFILLAAFHRATGRRLIVERPKMIRLLLLGALGYGFEASLYFYALKHAPAAEASLIFYSYPLWTTLIGFATGLEEFRGPTVAALAAGSAGVAFIFAVAAGGGLLGAAKTSMAGMLEPVTTVFLPALILGEDLTWRVLVGAALVVSALPLLATTQRPKKSPPPPRGVLGR